MINKGTEMMDYEKAYKLLFCGITKAIAQLESSMLVPPELDKAVTILKQSQIDTEQMYIEAE